MTVQSERANAFDEDDIAVLQGIANSLASALVNANLFQQVRNNLEEIRALNRQYLVESWARRLAEVSESPGSLTYTIGAAASHAEVEPGSEEQADGDVGQARLSIPLVLRQQPIGNLILDAAQGGFSLEDQAFVEAIATEAALALENVRLLEQSQQRAAYERLLADVSRQARSSSDLETILSITLGELGKALGASEGIIRLEMPRTDSSGGNGNTPLQRED
jgi:GAF domain-containing protein